MNIGRSISLYPTIEPAPLNMRVPLNVDVSLYLTMYTSTGVAPVNADVAGQLALTGRSSGRTQSYSLVATDIQNGKALVEIPAGDLDDKYGYNLALTGTYGGDLCVLAAGRVAMLGAVSGIEPGPIDVIDDIPLTFNRNNDVLLNVTLWASDGVPYDLSANATTIAANIFTAPGGALLMPLNAVVVDENVVQLSLPAASVATLPDTCWWALRAGTALGITTLCQGTVTVSGTVVPPFTGFTGVWNYTKQPTLVAPSAGQVIHSDNALDMIRIAAMGGEGTPVDHTVDLDKLAVGDTIQVGVTVWSIQNINKVASYYDVTISPASQAAVSGSQTFTFVRP